MTLLNILDIIRLPILIILSIIVGRIYFVILPKILELLKDK